MAVPSNEAISLPATNPNLCIQCRNPSRTSLLSAGSCQHQLCLECFTDRRTETKGQRILLCPSCARIPGHQSSNDASIVPTSPQCPSIADRERPIGASVTLSTTASTSMSIQNQDQASVSVASNSGTFGWKFDIDSPYISFHDPVSPNEVALSRLISGRSGPIPVISKTLPKPTSTGFAPCSVLNANSVSRLKDLSRELRTFLLRLQNLQHIANSSAPPANAIAQLEEGVTVLRSKLADLLNALYSANGSAKPSSSEIRSVVEFDAPLALIQADLSRIRSGEHPLLHNIALTHLPLLEYFQRLRFSEKYFHALADTIDKAVLPNVSPSASILTFPQWEELTRRIYMCSDYFWANIGSPEIDPTSEVLFEPTAVLSQPKVVNLELWKKPMNDKCKTRMDTLHRKLYGLQQTLGKASNLQVSTGAEPPRTEAEQTPVQLIQSVGKAIADSRRALTELLSAISESTPRPPARSIRVLLDLDPALLMIERDIERLGSFLSDDVVKETCLVQRHSFAKTGDIARLGSGKEGDIPRPGSGRVGEMPRLGSGAAEEKGKNVRDQYIEEMAQALSVPLKNATLEIDQIENFGLFDIPASDSKLSALGKAIFDQSFAFWQHLSAGRDKQSLPSEPSSKDPSFGLPSVHSIFSPGQKTSKVPIPAWPSKDEMPLIERIDMPPPRVDSPARKDPREGQLPRVRSAGLDRTTPPGYTKATPSNKSLEHPTPTSYSSTQVSKLVPPSPTSPTPTASASAGASTIVAISPSKSGPSSRTSPPAPAPTSMPAPTGTSGAIGTGTKTAIDPAQTLYSKQLDEILSSLELRGQFPGKLELTEAHEVCTLEEHQGQEKTGLGLIRKVMRYETNQVFQTSLPTTPVNILGASRWSIIRGTGTTGQTLEDSRAYHPMDKLLATFLCCNHLLQQALVTKMAQSLLALPLLYPSPTMQLLSQNAKSKRPSLTLFKWPLQNITLSYALKRQSFHFRLTEMNAKIVSFIRLGCCGRYSKSKLASQILSDDRFLFFPHREICGETRPKALVNGYLDFTWYLPTGEKTDNLQVDVPYLFLNLHGSGEKSIKQVQLLLKTSNVLFLLVDAEVLDHKEQYSDVLDTISFPTEFRIIWVLEMDESRAPEFLTYISSKYPELSNRSEPLLLSDLISIQNVRHQLVAFATASSDLSNICKLVKEARDLEIEIDEDQTRLKSNDEAASKIYQNFVNFGKQSSLPLQFTATEVVRLEKEFLRMRNRHRTEMAAEEYQARIIKDQNALAQKRIQYAQGLLLYETPILGLLRRCSQVSQSELPAFFASLKLKFDEYCTTVQIPLIEEYKLLKTKRAAVKSKEQNDPKLENEIAKIIESIKESRINIDNLLREIAHIYEIHLNNEKSLQKPNWLDWELLPKIPAILLSSGFPIELMDGDSTNILPRWVAAVIRNMPKVVLDSRVNIVGVLGVQSSGKSTMLNNMFGLDLLVSAGRCTRGIFAQLVPCSPRLQKQCGAQYLLLLDTEGLMSPEYAGDQTHDNELATFLVGLSDVTLVNVKGENTGELQGVLQVAAQAFLRMRQVEIHPRCILTQQNVDDARAPTQMISDREILLRTLDDAARMAARTEGIPGISRFMDIIEFDPTNDSSVFCIRNLWKGTPPMSAISETYALQMRQLLDALLEHIFETKDRTNQLQRIPQRLEDMWHAILQENFVFSFRNTLEILSYKKLEEQIVKWIYKLRSESRDQLGKYRNLIQGAKTVEGMKEIYTTEASQAMQIVYQEQVLKEFEVFFDADSILVQWKERSRTRLLDEKQRKTDELRGEIQRLVQARKMELETTENRDRYIQSFKLSSRALINVFMSAERLSENQLDEYFQGKWSEFLLNFQNQHGLQRSLSGNIHLYLEQCIQPILPEGKVHSSFLCCRLNSPARPKVPSEFEGVVKYWEKHVTQDLKQPKDAKHLFRHTRNFAVKLFAPSFDHVFKELPKLLQSCIAEVKKNLQREIKTSITLNEQMVENQFAYVLSELSAFEHDSQVQLLEPIWGTILLACWDLCFAACTAIEQEHLSLTDPVAYLDRHLKETYRKLFFLLYKNHTSGQCLTSYCCEHILKTALAKSKENSTEICADYLVETKRVLPESKMYLVTLCLYDMGVLIQRDKKAGLEAYRLFFKNSVNALREKFEQIVKDNCQSNRGDLQPRLVSDYRGKIAMAQQAVKTALQSGPASVVQLVDKIQEVINGSGLMVVNFEGVEMLELEREEISQLANQLFDKLETYRLEEPTIEIDMLSISDHVLHLQKAVSAIGCPERCPFCGAMCELNEEGHANMEGVAVDHRAFQHWPGGLIQWHRENEKTIVHEICPWLVACGHTFKCKENNWQPHPYKEYRMFFPKWHIPEDASIRTSPYWRWFLKEYGADLAALYELKPPVIPNNWESKEVPANWENAVKSLGQVYNFTVKGTVDEAN